MIDLDDVRRAAARLDGVAHRTPVVTSRTLDERTGATVRLKPENLQRVGAFKFRGAYNAVASLAPEERARGVVTASSGNHAQALALSAALHGVPATILMPEDAPALQGGGDRGLRRADRALRPLLGRPRGADRGVGGARRADAACTPTTTSGSWPGRAPRRSS